jgi:hypothetical protein
MQGTPLGASEPRGQLIIRIEKRMISLLCEAICSVKGTVFCLGNDEKQINECRHGRGGRRQRRIVRSKSKSKLHGAKIEQCTI